MNSNERPQGEFQIMSFPKLKSEERVNRYKNFKIENTFTIRSTATQVEFNPKDIYSYVVVHGATVI